MKKMTWFWKVNIDPWSSNEAEEWIPFADIISGQIEQAYQGQQSEVMISENYKIDLNRLLQVDIHDFDKQRPIRRCSKTGDIVAFYRRQRFNFAQPIRRSMTDDTLDYGCNFITDWLILFTKGTLKFKTSSLIAALISGILVEGEKQNHLVAAQSLIEEIQSIKKKTIGKLQRCCARLYTKPCFLFRSVNRTLRDDDRSKLDTLGPFCYLVFNYINIRHNEYLSIRNQLKRFIKRTDNTSEITVYRGETLSHDDIEMYRKAAGKGDFYKWLSFVSTSRSRDVAEKFGANVLHIITIRRFSSNDQYTDLQSIAYCKDEEEILLRPGVRFKVDDAYDDPNSERCIFHIQIEPSFISNLM
ncbi:unnamed protein product [Rotaria sp. Silwood2]|nr:unnamed protein product [Rotaria sp. Silwood2]CAF3160140.1 unnamed protein product [Rotaria sp. Silwood2]CAF4431717.1 unnamed protein product [Rotaria sp. Silwood2]CAF4485295.1 unnamed protein product [Rotaria sp. Silwood2]